MGQGASAGEKKEFLGPETAGVVLRGPERGKFMVNIQRAGVTVQSSDPFVHRPVCQRGPIVHQKCNQLGSNPGTCYYRSCWMPSSLVGCNDVILICTHRNLCWGIWLICGRFFAVTVYFSVIHARGEQFSFVRAL